MTDAPPVLVLVFRLAGEEFGVEIGAVREIVPVPERITRLPQAHAALTGVVNLRGTVLPLIDTRRRFGLPARGVDETAQVLVLETGGAPVGFVVDTVVEVLRADPALIRPAPGDPSRHPGPVSDLIGLPEGRLVLLLDLDRLTGADAPAAA